MEPISVMLVDDNQAFLRVMTEFLESQGDIRVAWSTHDGYEALARAPTLRPQVVLADIAMPGLHGLEFITRMRQIMPDVGIVALTVMDPRTFQNAALGAGANAFVPKSKARAELIAIIRLVAGHQQTEGKRAADSSAPSAAPHAPRVLVLEDDNHLRNVYARGLEGAGYTVYAAGSLDQARDLLTRVQFDVLVCDIYMGQERSTDFLQEHSELLLTSGAQIIMISGHARCRDMCEEMGADFFLEKPVPLSTLVALVKRITAQHSQALADNLPLEPTR